SSMKRFPGEYQKHRVFFADERAALAAGFRPCGNCLHAKYKEYMADPDKYYNGPHVKTSNEELMVNNRS
ncbi:MAG: hypothetical protein IIU49_00715, partial [Spirochaetales bacterium]|nr:hypothetical protein [Spirochaetales bacterium]